MAYATQSDLVDKFGELELIQLTDFDTPAAGGIVASRVDAALARASGVVDSYLAARYQLPLAEVPPAIQGAVLDLARFYLFRDAVPEDVGQAADRALRYLRDLADGRAALALAAGGTAAADPALPAVESGGAVFARSRDW